jgi:UDP-glucuronate 4-epimerase
MAGKHKTIMVTGSAGFIGFHLSKTLLDMGEKVIGIDNLNSYYDVSLKRSRLDILMSHKNFVFHKKEIQDFEALEKIFKRQEVDLICNLAAQAGVRYSLKDPFSYQKSNLEGFLNLLELARKYGITNFVYASSSSVYGNNRKIPFSEEDRVDSPVSLYGATKKSNELIAHAYSHLYKIPCTGLRYFTVYGPWGRPDMALFIFAEAILKKRPINVFNNGLMNRDFTYIDDIVEGTIAALERPSPYDIFNLGNSNSVGLLEFIRILEEEIGLKADKNLLPMQPGDVADTAADITKSRKLLGFNPKTPLREGIRKFLIWYRDYYDL